MSPLSNTPRSLKRTDSGVQLVRLIAAEGIRLFTVEEIRPLAERAGIRFDYVHEALHLLERNDWIVRIKQGLYAVSSTVPGLAPVHEFEIAMKLVEPAAISHWSALHYHGLTEQIPQTVFVLTPSSRSMPRVQGVNATPLAGARRQIPQFQFVSIKPEWFFGTQKVWIGDAPIQITDPERTLLDGLMKPKYCGDFAEVLYAFDRLGKKLDVGKIIRYALKLDGATVKRLGWVLEQQGVAVRSLEILRKFPISGYRRLDAGSDARGQHVRRWMIQENLPGAQI